MLNLGHVDLRQLQRLKVLVEERNVTRAASRLGLSQPSLSSALAKLRLTFQNPLLVRTTAGMSPTPCALELAAQYARIVDELKFIVTRHSSFDPASSTRLFRIQTNDCVIESLISRLHCLVGRTAPKVSIKLDYLPDSNFREQLENGDADLIIGHLPIPDDSLYARSLICTELCCIARKEHPRIRGKIDLEQYMCERHLCLSPGRGELPSFMDGFIDEILAREGRARTKVLQVPTILTMPGIVAESDLIAAVPALFAMNAAQHRPIQVLPFPIADFELNYSMIWHLRTDKDPGHRWLRKLIYGVSMELDQKQPPPVRQIRRRAGIEPSTAPREHENFCR